jgi:hypothetical protein
MSTPGVVLLATGTARPQPASIQQHPPCNAGPRTSTTSKSIHYEVPSESQAQLPEAELARVFALRSDTVASRL